MPRASLSLALLVVLPWMVPDAHAFLPDPSDLFTVGDIPKQTVQTVGIALDNRAYQPATPLGTGSGNFDISIEATAVRVPDSFKAALAEAGFGEAANIPVIPSPKMSIHKGISSRTDIGGSFVVFQGYYVAGGDLKVALSDPEREGPTLAFRMSYNYAKLTVVRTHTYSPQLLISRRMEFADPYLGIGYQYVRGTVQFTVPTDFPGIVVPIGPYQASGSGMLAFLGVGLRVPQVGLKLSIEGSYSSIQAHALGVKFGFNF